MEITAVRFETYKNPEAKTDIGNLNSEIQSDGDKALQNMQQIEAKREQEENS